MKAWLLLLIAICARAEDDGHSMHGMSLTPPVETRAVPATTTPGTPPPTTLPPQPPPSSDEDRRRVDEAKRRLIEKYPEARDVIESTLDNERLVPSQVHEKELRLFESYVLTRTAGISMISPKYIDLSRSFWDLPAGEREKRLKPVMERIQRENPRVYRQIGEFRVQLQGQMNGLMKTPLNEPLHAGGDPIADTLMEDGQGYNDRHDRDYIAANPNSPAPYAYSGRRQFENGEYAKAVGDLSQAIALDPSDGRSLTLRGAALRELGDFAGAARDAAAALKLDPNNKAAQNVYALSAGRAPLEAKGLGAGAAAGLGGAQALPASYGGTGGGAGAASSLKSLIAASGEAAREAGRQLALGDASKAARLADEAAAKNPSDLLARFYQSAARARQGDFAGALAAAESGLAIDPKSAALYVAKAQALNRLGRYRDALAAASAASGLNPRDSTAWIAAAEANAGLKDRGAALAALRAAAELDARWAPLAAAAESATSDEDLLTLFQGQAAPAQAAEGSGAGGEHSFPMGAAMGAGGAGLLIVLAAAAFKKRD